MVGPQLGCAALSGGHGPHLQRRNGIYHLRLRVPDELRLRVGLREIRRSLQTYSDSKARLLAAIYVPRVRSAIEMLKAGEFSRENAQRLIRGCFVALPTARPVELQTAAPTPAARRAVPKPCFRIGPS
jgi:hypothetical protein